MCHQQPVEWGERRVACRLLKPPEVVVNCCQRAPEADQFSNGQWPIGGPFVGDDLAHVCADHLWIACMQRQTAIGVHHAEIGAGDGRDSFFPDLFHQRHRIGRRIECKTRPDLVGNGIACRQILLRGQDQKGLPAG